MNEIRVLVADDEPLMVRAVATLLANEPSMELAATASDADQAIALAVIHRPDVAVVDVRMEGGGPKAARGIRAGSPATKVLAFSAYDDKESVLEMLAAGAVGYLLKGATGSDIVEAICRSVSGQSALSVGVTAEVIGELAGRLQAERREQARRRRRLERVRRALAEGGFTLVYQPIVDLRRGGTVGLEALARFGSHPRRAPEVWFEDAAAAGLRTELELTAIRGALLRLEDIPPPVYLSVNLSPETACTRELEDMIPLEHAHRVVLEVTEHAPVSDYGRLNGSLGALRARGVRLAIDDAGSGFSSLQHILRLAPDFIKLDMDLTRDVDNDLARRALAAALISFAAEIGAVIVAEGIETRAELETLRELGVRFGQGYYLARPEPFPSSDEAATASVASDRS
jgi:EAL domain-containing protein (putative c-di-GMP-specific phosphodiesterase class I)/DNA-binding NarL/FixJ family response regulator